MTVKVMDYSTKEQYFQEAVPVKAHAIQDPEVNSAGQITDQHPSS